MLNNTYTSCIKIGGNPILPPLLTSKYREDCREYKRKAIELENKKQRTQTFQKCMEDLVNLEHRMENLTRLEEEKTSINSFVPQLITLENQLAFSDQQTKHVPFSTFKKLQNLKRETIDVSEYNEHGVKLITKTQSEDTTIANVQPKLIRSNSYIIETPSPILLAHLEQQSCKNANDDSQNSTLESQSQSYYGVIETDITIEEFDITPPQDIFTLLDEQQEKEKSLIYHTSFTNCLSPEKVPDRQLENIYVKNCKNLDDSCIKERAASIIGAAVKGYLVRRLIRTEKVQNLIELIKDALLCAIQLHGTEVIEATDVELHRRLIQQVSAACYAFHDIFFTLSTKEQMEIIALDRQRRIEKSKSRPASAVSSRLSTPNLSNRSINNKQSNKLKIMR